MRPKKLLITFNSHIWYKIQFLITWPQGKKKKNIHAAVLPSEDLKGFKEVEREFLK